MLWKKAERKKIELLNQERIRTLEEKETYKYLGISEADTKQAEMKEKIRKIYLRQTGKNLEILFSRNIIKGINIWTVLLVRYLIPSFVGNLIPKLSLNKNSSNAV